MAHEIQGIVIADADRKIPLPGLVRCEIDLGYVFVPVPWEGSHPLCCPRAHHKNPAFPEFGRLTAKGLEFLETLSCDVPLTYIETGYFGGQGDQAALVLNKGVLRYGPRRGGKGVINEALRRIGVLVPEGSQEFDAIGLWRHRTTFAWLKCGLLDGQDDTETGGQS